MEHYYAVIMAGGGGTRLWPLSRKDRPKQSLKLLGERTMFQIAVDRLAPLFPPERICVVTSRAYTRDLRQQRPAVPDSNYILEPEPRNTAPALGLAAVTLRRRDPQAVMACLTADHYIRNEARFRALLGAAGEVAEMDFLATLGIAPTYPATGFGYIERGEHIGDWSDFKVYRAVRFTEKPRQPEAQVMVADGRHAWNSGMFVWKAERLLAEFARQMPDFHTHLRAMEADPAEIAQRWSHAPATSIDFGIMEGARDVAVIPAEGLGWSDIGSWESLYEVLEPDASGNVVLGAEHLSLASRGVLIHSSHAARRLVATVGVSNLVVVDTGDVLLVCPREKSQDVRALVEALKKQPNGDQYL